MAKIQIKRGLSENVQNLILSPGELAVTLDTQELYVGDANGQVKPISGVTTEVPIYEYDGDNTSEANKTLFKSLVAKAEAGEQFVVLSGNIIYNYNGAASNGDNYYFSALTSDVANNTTNDIDYRKFTECYFYYRKSDNTISTITKTSIYNIIDPEQLVDKGYVDAATGTDLSDYAKKEYVDEAIQNLVDNDIQTLTDLVKEVQDGGLASINFVENEEDELVEVKFTAKGEEVLGTLIIENNLASDNKNAALGAPQGAIVDGRLKTLESRKPVSNARILEIVKGGEE